MFQQLLDWGRRTLGDKQAAADYTQNSSTWSSFCNHFSIGINYWGVNFRWLGVSVTVAYGLVLNEWLFYYFFHMYKYIKVYQNHSSNIYFPPFWLSSCSKAHLFHFLACFVLIVVHSACYQFLVPLYHTACYWSPTIHSINLFISLLNNYIRCSIFLAVA